MAIGYHALLSWRDKLRLPVLIDGAVNAQTFVVYRRRDEDGSREAPMLTLSIAEETLETAKAKILLWL